MRKVFFLLISLAFIQCKSDKSYNTVINEAAESTVTLDSSSSHASITNGEDTIDNQLVEGMPQNTIEDDKESEVEVIKPIEKKNKQPKSSPPKKKPKPIISFENYVYEFGEITEGDIVKHDFFFTNTGNATLIVKNSTATCGCTVPSYPFIPIEPGEKGYIGVTYNSVGKSGKQTPVITVFSNATDPVVKIKMTGIVLEKPKEEEKY